MMTNKSDAELNNIIAEKFGYKNIRLEPEVWADVHNQWQAGWMGSKDGVRTQIPDFCNDSACTVMLMEKLIRKFNTSRRDVDKPPEDYTGWLDMGNSLRQIGNLVNEFRPSYYTEQQMNFRRAVAEAFATAYGLKT